jgi:hypothetical protein
VDTISAGIERNMREPGPYASENLKPADSGRFFDDYCNWERIPEFGEVVRQAPAAQAAAELMGSTSAQMFHDHVLVKEPGTSKPTPWHQDAPYYFVLTVGDAGRFRNHPGAKAPVRNAGAPLGSECPQDFGITPCGVIRSTACGRICASLCVSSGTDRPVFAASC